MPCAMEHKPNPGHELLPGLAGRAKWAVNTSTTTLNGWQGRRRDGGAGGGAVGSVAENGQLTLKLPAIRCITSTASAGTVCRRAAVAYARFGGRDRPASVS